MAKENQGTKEGGKDFWNSGVKGFPVGVGDSVGTWGRGVPALSQGGGDFL